MKICRLCKEDCSSKARVRDPEGHYYCKSCFDQQTAKEAGHVAATAAAAPRAAGPVSDPFAAAPEEALETGDDGFGLADLLGDVGPSDDGATMCPECGHQIRAGAALCVHCGYDPAKGKAMRTAVKGPERDPLEAEYAAKRARAASAAAMTPVRMIMVSVITGVVVAGLWMVIAASLHRDFRGMAVLAGLVIGAGTIKGARGDGGFMVGVTAALVALAAILGGRFGAVSMIVDEDIKLVQRQLVDEELVLAFLAEDIADEWEDEGRELDWPLGMRPEMIEYESDCPAELWEATEERWAGMSPAQQQNYTYQVDDTLNAMLDASSGVVKEAVFAANFNVFFLATCVVGVVVAFSMGMWGDDLPV